jgi:hypothetical protein
MSEDHIFETFTDLAAETDEHGKEIYATLGELIRTHKSPRKTLIALVINAALMYRFLRDNPEMATPIFLPGEKITLEDPDAYPHFMGVMIQYFLDHPATARALNDFYLSLTHGGKRIGEDDSFEPLDQIDPSSSTEH